jgi:ABC-type Fe3+/spermidine/putrescine transport system ATPase subunit
MTTVQLHHLSKSYDGHQNDGRHAAVSDLNLTMPCGQITALLGPSGCGKTTILKMVAGLLPATSGDITFDGRPVTAVPAERRGAVMVFQSHLLFPHLNVFDNVAFGLKMRGESKAAIQRRVAEMLDMVRMAGYGDRRPNQLSGGQRQRVALARALIIQPKVLLLDEPLSNLDAHLRNEMRDLIFSLQRRLGITTIVVTHDQEEAVILADHLALIFDGVLQQASEPAAFYEQPSKPEVARFFGGVNFIPGQKQGALVETGLGPLWSECPARLNNGAPNGPVILTIRPENVQFCAGQPNNSVSGLIVGHVYAGTHTRFRVTVDDPRLPPLEVVADAASQNEYRDGDRVRLHFPPEKLWVMSDA